MSTNAPGEEPDTLRVRGLDEAQERLRSHPGFVEHLRIEAFATTLNAVFGANLTLLLGLLRRAASDFQLQTQLIQNVARPDVRNAFNGAVIQALHNYVASTMTLVDHSRRLMQNRTDELQHEFSAKREELLCNPELRFVQELRNFMLHRSLPFLGHTMSMTDLQTDSPKVDMRIELSVAELLQWDGWSAGTIAFFDGHDGKLSLLPVIERHGDLVFRLNAWLINALGDANRSALEDANKIVVERNAILGGLDMDSARRLTDEVTRQREQVPFPPPSDDLPFGVRLSDQRAHDETPS